MFHSGPTWGIKDEERMGKLSYNCFKILGKGWENFYTIALKKQSTVFVDYQNGSEIYKWYQVLVQDLDKTVDENVLNYKVVKKVATPHFYINPPPPLFQVYPPFLEKNCIPPQVTQFLEGPTPPPPFDKCVCGGEGSNYVFTKYIR